MTDETLKYYIALQEKFRERMGEWQHGDIGYDLIGKSVCFCSQINDDGYFKFTVPLALICDESKILRLPLPIDPRNPERGCWGMVDWERFDPKFGCGGCIRIKEWDFDDNMIFDSNWQSPELALLKALAHQWKVEVR
ncbi:MAG: hypothetical protein WC455_17280 [Dehalococcoidia bacterium]|jgi:hypothetical protein